MKVSLNWAQAVSSVQLVKNKEQLIEKYFMDFAIAERLRK